MIRLTRTLLVPAVLAVAVGCTPDRSNPMQPSRTPPSVRGLVAGDALDHLDAAGRFILSSPEAPDAQPIISPERARDLAVAFLQTWGESHQLVWERQRGAPLNLGELRPASRVFYAESPHGRVPDGFHPAYRRMYGPWYVVYFEASEAPVLGVAISAYATDLEVRNGRINEPALGGEYYLTHVISTRGRSPLNPLSPEEAVEHVATRTSAKVTEVPELVLRPGWHPLQAVWRLKLDHPVHVRRKVGTTPPAGEKMAVSEVYVGTATTLFIAAKNQPPASPARVAFDAQGRHLYGAPVVRLQKRSAYPLILEEVALASEEASR